MKTRGDRVGRVLLSAGLVALVFPAWAEVKIDHDPLDKVKSNRRLALEAEVRVKGKDQAGVRDVRAYFKPDARYYFVPMRPQGDDKFKGVLPAMALGAGTFEYFLLARTGDDQIVKTAVFPVKVKDDKKALARMQSKPPTDIKIDVDQLEQVKRTVDSSRQVSASDRANVARQGGEPNPDSRVEVRSEDTQMPLIPKN